MKKPTKDLDFINEEGDPLKSDVKKMLLLPPEIKEPPKEPRVKITSSERMKQKALKQKLQQKIAQRWMAGSPAPNLPKSEMAKMVEMMKTNKMQFSEEGQKVLKEMAKRFDKAVKAKKADLQGPVDCKLFKDFDDLAASLNKWEGPGLKKKSDWKVSSHRPGQKKYQHASFGTVINRGGEFHAVPHGKEYSVSVHPTLEEAKAALAKKPKK